MEWYIAAIAVVALGVAAVVAAGGGGSMAKDPVRDTYAMTLPEGRLDGAEVRGLRFGTALRGYAMDQVDEVLDRVATDLEARDARIAQLESELGTGGAPPAGAHLTTAPVAGPPPTEPAVAPLDDSTSAWEQPR
jgi:DivIVA domain-containing protein